MDTNQVTPKVTDGDGLPFSERGDAPGNLLPDKTTTTELSDLKAFLDDSLGTQERRDHKRKRSFYKLWTQLAITVFLQTCLCFAALAFFVYVRPATNRPPNKHPKTMDRWPNILGVTVVLTVIGTATTFLLVFSLNWTQSPALENLPSIDATRHVRHNPQVLALAVRARAHGHDIRDAARTLHIRRHGPARRRGR